MNKQRKKCSNCGHKMETFSEVYEGSRDSDVFDREECMDCHAGCRLIALVDGKERFYRCCNCGSPDFR